MNIHLSRAHLLMQQHRFDLAEEQLRLALAEGSETATAHAFLSLCLIESGKIEDAILEAQQSIHEAPDEALGFYALAVGEWKRNRLKDARAAIEEAIRIEPWNSQSFQILSAIEGQQYRWQESLAAAEQGLACDPDDTGCNNLRAIAMVNLGRKAEAGQTIDAALAKNPEDAVTHANQGWTLLHQRQPVEAMKHFREALRLEPNLEWARHGIVEAMKARFFLYRWLLSFFLWMSRFPPNVRFGLLLGLVFGRTILANVLQSFPMLEVLVDPLSIAYVIFVWMTWTASSLFNLVLRLDPFGRLALSSDERQESSLVGICLIFSIAVGLSSILFDRSVASRLWMTSLLYLGLMLPLISVFRQPAHQKAWLTIYTFGVAFCVVMTTYLSLKVCSQFTSLAPSPDFTAERLAELRSLSDSGWQWFSYSVWGIVLSTWISAGLSLTPNRSHVG